MQAKARQRLKEAIGGGNLPVWLEVGTWTDLEESVARWSRWVASNLFVTLFFIISSIWWLALDSELVGAMILDFEYGATLDFEYF